MVKAYIIIEVEGVDANKVAKDLTSLEEVENAHIIDGEYDLIALVNTKTVIQLKEVTEKKIEAIKGISKITTLIVVDANKPKP
ncbi:Lrp/AsnC ligand binding domain-containing protein [Candidatus Woesearchaeota archaeon]|nr:Lrp/AsnC ligand binding domain-containing protein [Candidatus Woesearchaeota archaeon]